MTCPECNGKCCRNIDTKYRTQHMGAEVYEHMCEACHDGTMPLATEYRRKLAERPREEILAEWDRQPAHHREMCAHWLLKLKRVTEESVADAGKYGWHANKADLVGGVIALAIAMDLLAHKGDKEG
jgi:hypothetical protein